MIKIYGTSQSRAARSLWALEELGLKYEHSPVSFTGDTRKPDYLKINPNGRIPAIDDDGAILWESMAINLYLADKYGKAPLWPATVEGRGAAYQWSLWGMTETEPHLIAILMHRMFLPAEQRSDKAVAAATEALKAPFAVLDSHLKGREHLLGKDFTIADLNVASVLSLAMLVKFDFSATPTAQAWLNKCLARPANQRAANLK
ncbi:MAG: glutathione S-transferase family protein [Candidatus Binataceae bacterium]